MNDNICLSICVTIVVISIAVCVITVVNSGYKKRQLYIENGYVQKVVPGDVYTKQVWTNNNE